MTASRSRNAQIFDRKNVRKESKHIRFNGYSERKKKRKYNNNNEIQWINNISSNNKPAIASLNNA